MMLPNPNYTYYEAIYYNSNNTVYGGAISKSDNIWSLNSYQFGIITNPAY